MNNGGILFPDGTQQTTAGGGSSSVGTGALVSGTVQSTTSGTFFDYVIPAGVKRISLTVRGVSTNGTSPVVVRMGSAGAIVSTGYSASSFYTGTNSAWYTIDSSSFPLTSTGATAGSLSSGTVTYSLLNGNTWTESGTINNTASGGVAWWIGGGVTLPGSMDRIRLTTLNGTDAFTAGQINILYEYGPITGNVGSIVPATAQDTTTGTSFDFPNIPVGTKRITVAFNNISSAATVANNFQIQLGAGAIDATAYNQYAQFITSSNQVGNNTGSTGFAVGNFGKDFSHTGSLVLVNISGNLWEATGHFTGAGGSTVVTGTKTLTGALDRVRITINGTDTFDLGSVNVFYEYGATNIGSSGDSQGFKNRIINGGMNIWQRGTTFTNPQAGGNFFTADRFGCNRASDVTGMTVSRSTIAPSGFLYSMALQRTQANTATNGLYLFCSNESANTIDLAGNVIAFSFWAKTGTTYSGGALSVSVISGTGADEKVYLYTGSTNVISTSQTISTNWTRYSFTGTVPTDSKEIGFILSWVPAGTAGADDTVYITGIQLEKNSVATSFDFRSIGTELTLCQRYYQTPGNGAQLYISYYSNYYSQQRAATFQFVVPMRITPTMTGTYTGDAGGTGTGCYALSPSAFQLTCTLNATNSFGTYYNITANAEI